MDARTRFKAYGTLTFVFELDPALEDVDHLERGLVQVGLAGERLTCSRPDHMGVDSAPGRRLDAKVPILIKGAQTTLELCILGVRRDETFRCHGSSLPGHLDLEI
ncbi:hypothetical protein [Rhizobacter sp. Root404]|uniref:hypothetical protein n=1 Tax=Rhizobacter sp. Root404 TaxID=1736528 RepID=UPI001F26F58B|nr:hypothetical protein [Rhizobacter sp. Root404]